MAKKIIILETVTDTTILLRCVFWADVPAARVTAYANTAATSQYKDASAAELLAIQNGQVTEQLLQREYAPGTTGAAIQADLVAEFNAYQARITGANPRKRYGTFWDGTSWTVGGTA